MVVSELILYSVADLLQLTIGEVEEMSRASVFEVGLGPLESEIAPNNTYFGKIESPLGSKNSELVTLAENFFRPSIVFVWQEMRSPLC